MFSTERSGRTGRERVVRHVGVRHRSYERAYVALTGERMGVGAGRVELRTHAMTFERAFVEELLGASRTRGRTGSVTSPAANRLLPEFSANVFGETRPTFSASRDSVGASRAAV